MLETQTNSHAGKTRVQMFEEAIAEMKADRILPADFQIKEIGENISWGMNEGGVVYWDNSFCAFSNIPTQQDQFPFLCWNDDETELEIREGWYFHREPAFDISSLKEVQEIIKSIMSKNEGIRKLIIEILVMYSR